MIYLIFYFANLFKVYLGPCARVFFIFSWRITQTVCMIFFVLASSTLLVVGQWGGETYQKYFPAVFRMVEICPLVGFLCFTRCVFHYLGIWENSWGLCSFLEGSTSTFCVRHFCGRLQSCQKSLWPFLRYLDRLFCMIFCIVYTLVAGLLYSPALVWQWYCGIIVT